MIETCPFRSVTLSFVLPRTEETEVGIFDLAGRSVRRLHRGLLQGGEQRFAWDGRNDAGRSVAVGLYVARVRAPSLISNSKVLRLR